jgi:hypothetical protein
MLLRERHMQPPSRQKEKLDYLDIRRQRPACSASA